MIKCLLNSDVQGQLGIFFGARVSQGGGMGWVGEYTPLISLVT